MSLLFNTLSRFIIVFLPKNKHLLISWLQCPLHVHSDFGAQENKVSHCLPCLPIYLPWSDKRDAMIFIFWKLSVKSAFSLELVFTWLMDSIYLFFFVFCCFLSFSWMLTTRIEDRSLHCTFWGCLCDFFVCSLTWIWFVSHKLGTPLVLSMK